MNISSKILFLSVMSLALGFGFMHHFAGSETHFDRLHIFLFNLVGGGTIIIVYTIGRVSLKVVAFFFLSLSYAILSFFEIYAPAIGVGIALSGVVESARIERFSLFPWDFFKNKILVSDKFHQAALLCLSIGVFISAFVILNNEYFKWVTLEKLQLDTFFLGFSFPVSLITLSVVFTMIQDEKTAVAFDLKNLSFWIINLGVIIFFLFILAELLVPQLVATIVLLCGVVMIFILFRKYCIISQQKMFLTSAMVFLLFTAITGIIYILFSFIQGVDARLAELVLKLHAFASLYGWNLTGLAIIIRKNDFPLVLHSRFAISWHWVTVIILAPLGYYMAPMALVATLCYVALLWIILFSSGIKTAA